MQRRVFGALLSCTAASVAVASAADVSGNQYVFAIERQPIAATLREFSQQSGLNVSFVFDGHDSKDDSKNILAGPLDGRYNVEGALNELLADSGLTFVRINAATVAVISRERLELRTLTPKFQRLGLSAINTVGPIKFLRVAGAPGAQGSPGGTNAEQTETRAKGLEEIVVTAQKRSQNIQDVPMSIAALGVDEIDRRGLVSAEDYLRGIPGVNQVTDSAFGGAIVIRGIETTPRAQNALSGSTVATYFGETPTTSSSGLTGGSNVDLKLVDVDRVEVLRGPQGTAFGNASLGGAVRTIPTAPKLDGWQGKVRASYSATSGSGGDNHMVQVVGNIPLIQDKLAIRAVAYQFEDAGFYRNVAGSDPSVLPVAASRDALAFATNDDEVGAASFNGGRISALFQATDELKFTLSYLTQKTEVDGQPFAGTSTYQQSILQVAPEHVRRGQTGGFADTDIDLANATVEYDLGWADVLATFSHIDSGSQLALTYIYAPALPHSEYGESEHRERSGEIRLTTHLDGGWDFLGGVYAEDLEDRGHYNDIWYGSVASSFGPERELGDQREYRDLKQKAAFGEVSWEFLPGLTVTGGARYYDYERAGRLDNTGYFGASVPADNADASGTKFRGNLSYKPTENSLVYADWSQGFRLGRPQAGVPASVCDLNNDGVVDGSSVTVAQTRFLDSDEVDNYGLGSKLTLLDGRLALAADIYRIDWEGVPFQVIPSCGRGYLTNAFGARSEGVEFQMSYQIAEPLRVDVGGSWIHARLTDDVPSQGAFEDDRLPGSPKVNANLAVQYEFAIAGHEAFIRADTIYVGTFYGNFQELPETRAGGYTKVDASARVMLNNLSVDLFVNNLTDVDEFTFRGIFGGQGEFYGFRMRPRTIGIQLGYSF